MGSSKRDHVIIRDTGNGWCAYSLDDEFFLREMPLEYFAEAADSSWEHARRVPYIAVGKMLNAIRDALIIMHKQDAEDSDK